MQPSDMFPLRPIHEDGIPPYAIEEAIGRKLLRSKKADAYLSMDDFELC
mgnify:CR=1 FL=1